MVQVLDPGPSLAQRLGLALGGGLEAGVSEYNRAKEVQRKRQSEINKVLEGLHKYAGSYLKGRRDDILDDPKRYDEFLKSIEPFIRQGVNQKDAIDFVLNLQDAQKESEAAQYQQGGLWERLKAHLFGMDSSPKQGQEAESARAEGEVIPQAEKKATPTSGTPGLLAALGQPITEPLASNQLGVLGQPFTKPLSEISRKLTDPLRPEEVEFFKSPGTILGSLAAGAAEPVEDLIRRALMGPKGAETHPVTEAIRKRARSGLSPEAAQLAEKMELVGMAIPIERVLSGAVKALGSEKVRKFLSTAAKAKGKNAKKVMEETAKAAEKAGIDLNKVAAGDKAEANRLFKIMHEEETPTTARVGRVRKEGRAYKKASEEELLAKQEKAEPKLKERISAAEEKKAAEKARKEGEGPRARATREAKRQAAHEQLPKAREDYYKAIQRLRKTEDEYNRASASKKVQLDPFLKRARSELQESEDALKAVVDNSRLGESRVGLAAHRDAAQAKIFDLFDKIDKGETFESLNLKEWDYKPERIKEAKNLEKMRKVPGKGETDYLEKVHRNYQAVYERELAKIDRQLKAVEAQKGIPAAERADVLRKKKDLLEKLIAHTKADRSIHQNNVRLREIGTRVKKARGFKSAEGKQASRVSRPTAKMKETHERIREHLKNPSKEHQAENIAEEIGKASKERVSKEEVQEGMEQIRNNWKKAEETLTKEAEAGLAAGKTGPTRRFIKEIADFLNQMRKGKLISAMKTPLARHIAYGVGLGMIEDFAKWIEPDVPLTGVYGSIGLGLIGKGTAAQRTARVVSNFIYKEFRMKAKIRKLQRAQQDNPAEYVRLKKKYGPKISRLAIERKNS